MPDYNKLTVIKLREELVKRGLPKTGLKPVLVNRLLEADAQTETQDATPDVPVSDAPAVQEQLETQNKPSDRPQNNRQRRGEGDGEGGPNNTQRSSGGKYTGSTDPGSPKKAQPLDGEATIVRANEHILDAPRPPEVQHAEVVHALAAEAGPESGRSPESHMSANACDPILPDSEVADAVELQVSRHRGEEVLGIQDSDEHLKQAQETPQIAVSSEVCEQKFIAQDAGAATQNTEAQQIIESEVSSTIIEQQPSEEESQKTLRVIEAKETFHIIVPFQTPEKNPPGEAPEESPNAVEAPQNGTPSNDTNKNIEEVPEKDSTRQPDGDQGSPPETPSPKEPTAPMIEAEALDDNKKRKRRSQSPPPMVDEIAQKRARINHTRPGVILPEDTDMHDVADGKAERLEDARMADPVADDLPGNALTDRHTQSPEKKSAAVVQGIGATIGKESHQPALPNKGPGSPKHTESQPGASVKEPQLTDDTQAQPAGPGTGSKSPKDGEPKPDTSNEAPKITRGEDIAVKLSPHDTRFKKLFTGPPNRPASPARQVADVEDEDHSISPALHPATSALYIRDFMRPLQPSHLKDHLVALATPISPSASASPSTQIITEFFLDPIRTHCLVGFTSTAAASRVRSSLHNRVWPDERTRRPLWVDFVPEEKLQKWIEVEKDVGSQRGQGAKRWEVVYEEEQGDIKAYLQEAGSGSRPPPSHPSSRLKPDTLQVPPGVVGAPSGPRSRPTEALRSEQQQKQALAPPADIGKGFQALDDLFRSTTTKPKLYYLPVSKAVADKRLEQLAELKGGGRGANEIRKYTFEGDVLVDRGGEIGGRVRGGFGGGRRGRGGGGSGRAGGYRGEEWGGRVRERNRDEEMWEREEGLRERARREIWRERDRGDSFRERDRPEAWRENYREGGWRGNR